MREPIYTTVKSKPEVIKLVKEMIKEGQFYRHDEEQKERQLQFLSSALSQIYGVDVPLLKVDTNSFNHYSPVVKRIVLENTSIISFLHEYRHHLQCVKGLHYRRLSPKPDARAWSLRLFKKAVPKMFEKAVKADRVLFVAWDEQENKIVDAGGYQ